MSLFTPTAFFGGEAPAAYEVTPGFAHYYDTSDTNSYPGTGATWFDIGSGSVDGGYNVDIAITGSVSWTTEGTIPVFKPTLRGDRMEGTYTTGTKFLDRVTLEAWIYVYTGEIDSTTDKGNVMLFEYQNFPFYHSVQKSGGDLNKTAGYKVGPSTNYYYSDSAITRGQWLHTVIAYGASSDPNNPNTMRFFHNGVDVRSNPAFNWNIANHSNAGGTKIMLMSENSNRTINAAYAKVRIYDNLCLTDTEINNNFEAERAYFGV